jgi:hypothetical protein
VLLLLLLLLVTVLLLLLLLLRGNAQLECQGPNNATPYLLVLLFAALGLCWGLLPMQCTEAGTVQLLPTTNGSPDATYLLVLLCATDTADACQKVGSRCTGGSQCGVCSSCCAACTAVHLRTVQVAERLLFNSGHCTGSRHIS